MKAGPCGAAVGGAHPKGMGRYSRTRITHPCSCATSLSLCLGPVFRPFPQLTSRPVQVSGECRLHVGNAALRVSRSPASRSAAFTASSVNLEAISLLTNFALCWWTPRT